MGVALLHRIGTPSGKTGFLNNTLTDTKNHPIYTFLGFIQSDQADIQKTLWHYKAILPLTFYTPTCASNTGLLRNCPLHQVRDATRALSLARR